MKKTKKIDKNMVTLGFWASGEGSVSEPPHMSPGFFGWSQLPLRSQGFWKKFSSRKILSKFFSKSLKFPRFLRPAEKTRAHMGRFKNCPSVKTQRKSVPTMAKNQVIQNQGIPTTMVWPKISDTRKPNAIQYLLWPRINHFQKDFNRKIIQKRSKRAKGKVGTKN